MMAMAGLRRPDEGTVRIFGQDPTIAQNRRAVGLLPDRPALHPELTARDHLDLVAAAYGIAEPEVRIAEVMGRLDLGAIAQGLVGTFSAGMHKRLALALALLPSRGCCCSTSLWSVSTRSRSAWWSTRWPRNTPAASP